MTASSAEPNGFEDLVLLFAAALPDVNKDPNGEVRTMLDTLREFLRGVHPDDAAASVLTGARHALLSCRGAGRPSLSSYACKTSLSMVKKLLALQGSAYSAVLTPYHDNGLFANVLQVCDALLLAKPGVPVLVDWKRKGSEGHFQYGPEGFDLFGHLFEAGERCRSATEVPSESLSMPGRINCLFMNMLRGYFWSLPEDALKELRLRYAAAIRVLQPAQHVQRKLQECTSWTEEALVVGVHKRLACSEMVACQLSQRAPSCAEFIAKAHKILSASEKQRKLIFLATDDVKAVEEFEVAFPRDGDVELCYRRVKRSPGGVREDGIDNEVHRSPCAEADAEDALIDALALSRCQHLVCVDSNLAIYVALLNPEMQLHALSSILPEGWEDAAERPEEVVHASYEVVFAPMVFVRKGPSTATELLGARKPGEIVYCTGRGFDGWVELEGGGWMLVDGARGGKQNAAAGTLLKPVGDTLAPQTNRGYLKSADEP